MSIVPALAIGLAAAGTAAGAGISLYQAQQQNKAIKKSKESNKQAAAVKSKQVAASAENERQKLLLRQERVRGAIAAAGGESGFSLDDFAPLLNQADTDTGLNLAALRQNLALDLQSIDSGLDVNLSILENQQQNALLGSITGGLGGFSTGLSIGNDLETAKRLKATNP